MSRLRRDFGKYNARARVYSEVVGKNEDRAVFNLSRWKTSANCRNRKGREGERRIRN